MHLLAQIERRPPWTPKVTVDRDGAIAAVAAAIEARPEVSAVEEAVRRGLCPAGLLSPDVAPLLAIADAPERFHGPAFGGGALEDPAWLLQASKIVGERRRRAQDRMVRAMEKK